MGPFRVAVCLLLTASLVVSCSSPGSPGPVAPPAPAGISASNTTGQDTISWAAVGGATSYNLYWSTTNGVTKANGTRITGTTSPYTHAALSNGTTYYYVVTAVNAEGESTESGQASATPIAAPTGTIVQDIKEGLETDLEWNLNWNPVTGATSYDVYYSVLSNVTPVTGTKVANAGSYFWPLGTVPHADYFIVTAVNAGGESSPSSPAVNSP